MLQPNLGMPMEFQTRIQTNIVMKKIRYNSKISHFSNLTLPIVWIGLVSIKFPFPAVIFFCLSPDTFFFSVRQELEGLPNYITFLLYLIVFVAPGLMIAIVVISFISGISLFIYSSFNLFKLEGWIKKHVIERKNYPSLKLSSFKITKPNENFHGSHEKGGQIFLPIT